MDDALAQRMIVVQAVCVIRSNSAALLMPIPYLSVKRKWKTHTCIWREDSALLNIYIHTEQSGSLQVPANKSCLVSCVHIWSSYSFYFLPSNQTISTTWIGSQWGVGEKQKKVSYPARGTRVEMSIISRLDVLPHSHFVVIFDIVATTRIRKVDAIW